MGKLSSHRSSVGVLLLSIALSFLTSALSASSRGEVRYHSQEVVRPEQSECSEGDSSCYWDDDEYEEYEYSDEDDDDDEEEEEQTDRFSSRKKQQNQTVKDRGDSSLKQATKGTHNTAEDDELLQWLSNKAVPEAKACGIYLAPSTIPGAGLGMFAGQAFNPNDIVTQGDIIIPLSELDWHNGFQLDFFLWEEYTWSASSFLGMEEENGYQSGMQGCSPGIGAAINCDLPLVNVVDTWSKIDRGGLHRDKDPGAGAITPYFDRKSRATRSIRPGEELYIDYGENYFESREGIYGLMPMIRHYRRADKLLLRYQEIRENVFQNVPRHMTDTIEADLWQLITDWAFESRTINALPRNASRIDQLMADGGSAWQNYERSQRDIKWLEENGQCMDNIRPGKSTIPQAGRGAFATRHIPKGGLVAPAPLIHIGDKSELVMYEVLPENEDGLVQRNTSHPVGHQLLLNYCFGHKNSTLLLSPYGYLNSLINHSPTNANTRIQWTKMSVRSPEWMEMAPEEFAMEHHSGLQLDFIALRDIEANEEILIDYGIEWEEAWKKHVREYDKKKPENSDKYQAAYDLQREHDLKVQTVDEGQFGPAVLIYCHEAYRLMNGLRPSEHDHHKCRAVKRYIDAAEHTLYMVEIFDRTEEDGYSYDQVSEVLFDVPRDIFHFEDAPYTRDHCLPFAFRHEMMIPDDMFPKAWMNMNQ